MKLIATARVLAQHALWRATGWDAAGRAVVRALGAADPTVRTIAGMLLVRAGRRALRPLQEALAARENLPMVLSILGDIGQRQVEPQLRQFSKDPDPAVAQAARDALRVLQVQP